MAIEELLEGERAQIRLDLKYLRKRRTELKRSQKKLLIKMGRLKSKLASISKRATKLRLPTKAESG